MERGAMGIREDLLELSVEIGPRGACTAAEGRAARYVRSRFEERGLDCNAQEFFCITTYSYLYMIYFTIAIACAVLSKWFPYYAAPVAIVFAVLFAADLETFPLISRILPKKLSRNIIAELPSESGKVDLVVVAHYDSAKSALSFRPGVVSSFRLSFSLMIGSVLAVAVLSSANLVFRAATGSTNLAVWIVTLLPAAYLLVPFAVMLHRENSMSYTPGANDTASGVVTLLALMDKLSEEQSRFGGVMFLATGAEEVGTAGMIEFLRKEGGRLKGSLIVNLDNLGKGHLCYIDCEGMLLGHRSDDVLLWLSGKVADKKKLPIWRTGYRLLSTDATPALARGYSAMSVMAFDDKGTLPNWHWESDTIDNVDMSNLESARAFLWNLAKEIEL